jgi:nucleoside-diphosphate-sugar epimerase
MSAILNMVGNLYGPRGDNFWVNIFMQKAKNGEEITVYGDGSASRDMLYIDDLTDLLVDQIDNFDLYAKHPIIPVGGGKDNVLSVKQLLDWLKYDHVTYKEDLSGLQHDRFTDNRRVTAINGWKPTTSIDEGLELTYNSLI